MLVRRSMMVATLLAGSVAGCTSVKVYEANPSEPNKPTSYRELPGIPFYSKVPVLTQTTKRVSSELSVQVVVTEIVGGKAGRSQTLPVAGVLRLQAKPEVRAALRQEFEKLIVAARTDALDAGAASAKVQEKLADLGKRFPAPAGPATDERTTVVANAWGLKMLTGPRELFISTRQPVFGSAQSAFKFSDDGTLTEASQTITDDTAKTLLALFPIADKMKLRWGISAAAPQMNVAPPPSKEVEIDVSVDEVQTAYLLEKVTELDKTKPIGSYFAPATPTPLLLSKGLAGTDGVQLTAIVTTSSSSGGDRKPADDKAYQLQGTITPPKEAIKAGDAAQKGNTDPSKGPVTK